MTEQLESTLVASGVDVGDHEALVVCIGTSTDQNTRVLQSVGQDALVVVAADTGSVVQLLKGVGGPVDAAGSWGPAKAPTVRRGRLRIDPSAREVWWGDQPITLSARGFDLLSALASQEGRVWTFAELTDQVWRRAYVGDDDSVTSAIKRLRARIAGVTHDVAVVSVRGVGYRLVVRDGSPDERM